jgi:hypothetical protein
MLWPELVYRQRAMPTSPRQISVILTAVKIHPFRSSPKSCPFLYVTMAVDTDRSHAYACSASVLMLLSHGGRDMLRATPSLGTWRVHEQFLEEIGWGNPSVIATNHIQSPPWYN